MKKTTREDAPYQQKVRWRGSVWRYAIALLVSAIFFPTTGTRTWIAIDIVVGVICFILLRYRHRWPLRITMLINAGTLVSFTAYGPAAFATGSLATRRRWREIIPAALMWAIVGTAGLYIPGRDIPDAEDWKEMATSLAIYFGMIAMVIGWGLYLGYRRALIWNLHERADRLEREQELLTEQARDAERAQIAREMHDVLAHRISQISMQAGAIAFRTDLDADELRSAAAELQQNANAALVDLRGVLGVLRDPDSGAVLDTPQPRLDDIDSMIEKARSDGMRIVADVRVQAGLDETIGRTLYRIVQECVTNARKHAPATVLTISVEGSEESGVTLIATNPIPIGSRGSTAIPGSGFGLIGLTERAELAGGELTVDQSGGSFTLTCRLPWQSALQPTEYAQ